MRLLPLILSLGFALTGCEKRIGEPCEVDGDGFTRRDPCKQMCVEWPVTCPDGREVTPNECSGFVCGDDGECPEGQICLQVDSVPSNARCMLIEVCE